MGLKPIAVRTNVLVMCIPQHIVWELTKLIDMAVKRACPRCQGYLHADRDVYGPYKECLQCGYMEDIPKLVDPRPASVTTRQAA